MHRLTSRVQFASCQAILFAAAASTSAQVDLFSNGSASPGLPALAQSTVSASGVTAPANFFWSETPSSGAAEANAVAGFSSHFAGLTGSYRFADDFTVPGPDAWHIDWVSFFAYQTGASPLSSPFSGINVRIWSGRPGDQSSTIVFGDTSTNRLTSTVSSGIYRIFNSVVAPLPLAPDTSRFLWRTDAMLNISLQPGTYWIDWQYISTNPAEEAFSPPVTVAGSRGPANANARQFRINGGSDPSTWAAIVDLGKPSSAADVAQDLPFIIHGSIGGPCSADFNADGMVNSQDFFDFLAAFFSGVPEADVNHDSMVNSQDFFDFVTFFFAGC